MATQQQLDSGVPFAIAVRAQKLQLLELPPNVAALLDAPNPPRCALSPRLRLSPHLASACILF